MGRSMSQADPAVQAVRQLLIELGENPDREGLIETPQRVVRAFREMTSGKDDDPSEHLKKLFACKSDSMVIVRGIRFTSLCEHHLLPFQGTAAVGYIPSAGKVVGLSKLARVVVGYARRLQLQEQLAHQIADAMESRIPNLGVAVYLVATHSCMGCRGVHQQDAEMVTTVLRGIIKEKADARAEFMSAVRSSIA
jgi:GTP cyclohydrolase I